MRNKKSKIIIGILILAAIFALMRLKTKHPEDKKEITKEIKPVMGLVQSVISTTGSVLPKNRLEVKPPVNGRIDKILVKEGDLVKMGQMLAWMSSTERAAILDAAGGQGEEALKYWKEVYKGIPLISPIDGEVIVAKTQPGQTVTTSDAVIVLSDQLIVRAQVDEIDIGKIRLGQEAVISLDAYPDKKIKATVDHMYYESKIVNNVTIYEVDLDPQEVPEFFRSGMNATIDFIEEGKENALLIPSDAVLRESHQTYVLVKQTGGEEPQKRPVKLGVSDDKNVEVISGLNPDDIIIVKTKRYSLPKNNIGGNPFIPSRSPKK